MCKEAAAVRRKKLKIKANEKPGKLFLKTFKDSRLTFVFVINNCFDFLGFIPINISKVAWGTHPPPPLPCLWVSCGYDRKSICFVTALLPDLADRQSWWHLSLLGLILSRLNWDATESMHTQNLESAYAHAAQMKLTLSPTSKCLCPLIGCVFSASLFLTPAFHMFVH